MVLRCRGKLNRLAAGRTTETRTRRAGGEGQVREGHMKERHVGEGTSCGEGTRESGARGRGALGEGHVGEGTWRTCRGDEGVWGGGTRPTGWYRLAFCTSAGTTAANQGNVSTPFATSSKQQASTPFSPLPPPTTFHQGPHVRVCTDAQMPCRSAQQLHDVCIAEYRCPLLTRSRLQHTCAHHQ